MEEEALDGANQIFYSRMTTLMYNLWNPGFPLSFDKMPKGQNFHENKEIFEFNTPISNYKLKESFQNDKKYHRETVNDFFKDVDQIFDHGNDETIEFYPVRISRIGNQESPSKIRDNESYAPSVTSSRTAKTSKTDKTFKSGVTDSTRASKSRTPTNFERKHAEKIREMKLRREEKKLSEEKLSPEERKAKELMRKKAKKAYEEQISRSPEQRYKHLMNTEDSPMQPAREPVKVPESTFREESLAKFKESHPDGPLPQLLRKKL